MPRLTVRRFIAVMAFVVSALAVAPAAEATLGDYHLLRGTIIVWPPGSPPAGVVVVRATDGTRYFVRFDLGTALSPGLAQGDSVAVVGREGGQPDRISATTVERWPAAPATARVTR
jgi:hypothetical protein